MLDGDDAGRARARERVENRAAFGRAREYAATRERLRERREVRFGKGLAGNGPHGTSIAPERIADETIISTRKRRPAYFAEAAGYVDTPVYDRYRLTSGARLEGPAIVEERESTTVIGPGARVIVDTRLTLIAEPAA